MKLCLCFVTLRIESFLYIINGRKLFRLEPGELLKLGVEEVVDWGSLESSPFEMCLDDLPERDLRHFSVGGSILLGGGFELGNEQNNIPSYNIFELYTDRDNKPHLVISPFLPDSFVPMFDCFVGSYNGDVYHVVPFNRNIGGRMIEERGVYHFSRLGRCWKRSEIPARVRYNEDERRYTKCFIVQKLLFVYFSLESILYSFDLTNRVWNRTNYAILESYRLSSSAGPSTSQQQGQRTLTFPSILLSMPAFNSCTVGLAWSEQLDTSNGVIEISVIALLINNANGKVIMHQSLKECLLGVHPNTLNPGCKVNFVHLEENKICVLVYGVTPQYGPVMFLSVFTLMMKDLYIELDAPPTEKDFLSVHINVRRVFSSVDCGEEEQMDAFFFHPTGC